MKIMLLEDDITLAFGVKEYFKQQGYDIVVFYSIQEAYRKYTPDFDVAILDINLSDGLGFEIIPLLKDTPFVFLSVLSEEEDILTGFEHGAYDYLTKPFSLKELETRIITILNRHKTNTIEYKNLVINLEEANVYLNGSFVHLTTQEYKLILLLLKNQDIILNPQIIMDTLWGYSESNTLSVTIKRLRDKLEPHLRIINVRGKGYQLQ